MTSLPRNQTGMKRTLTIEIDDVAQAVSVTDIEEGQAPKTYLLEGIGVFGADATHNELFVQMYGASADVAWSFGQAWRQSRMEGAGKGIKNFFKQAVAHICMAIDPDAFRLEVGAEELLNKWECQDQSKWFGWDTEDVLADKQESERKKAAGHVCACKVKKGDKAWN